MDIDLDDLHRIINSRNEQNIIYVWNTYHYGGVTNELKLNYLGKIHKNS